MNFSTVSHKPKPSKKHLELVCLVERGYQIHQQIAVLQEEFKQIKDRLKYEAALRPAEHIPLKDKESEGSQWVLGGEACQCHVIFPNARLITEFEPTEPALNTIRSLTGQQFSFLFREAVVYRLADKKTFRDQILHQFSPKTVIELLNLSTQPSEPKTVWKARAS